MGTKDWLAFAVLILVAVFFMVAYFTKPPGGNTAGIIRIFCALLAGAAGMILAGTIVVNVQGRLSDGATLAVQAGGAVGLFVLVWFTFPMPPVLQQGFNVSFPPGTNFKQAASLIAEAVQSSLDFRGFTPEEETTRLEQLHLKALTPDGALKQLSHMLPKGKVRAYVVAAEGGAYSIRPL